MKRNIIFPVLLSLVIAGCGNMSVITPIHNARVPQITDPNTRGNIKVGEKLSFLIAWKGIPVGHATSEVKELTTLEGRPVYKIVVNARGTDFLNKFFTVEDTFISYADKETLESRRFEATIREGNYKKDLVVTYDVDKKIAYYKNERDGTVKTCPVNGNTYDPVCAAYYLRTLPIRVGESPAAFITVSEKNYAVRADVESVAAVSMPGMNESEAFLIRPRVKEEGKDFKRGKAWGYMSTDEKRLILFVFVNVLEIPWIGGVTARLEKIEYS